MNRHIKHIILWALAIIVMAACGGGGSDVPSPAPTPTPTPTPTNPTDPTPDPDPTPTPTPEPQQVPIGFKADLLDAVASTRSVGDGEYNNTMLRNDGFGVFCWYTKTTAFDKPKTSENMMMRNQKVENVSLQWTYSPSKYWPLNTDEMLTFRAYAPYTDYMVTDDNGTPSLPVVLGTTKVDGVLYGTDYENGTQHDPLFGTDIHGKKYTDVTYAKSGSNRLASDSRDGIIDWYFHHGMAKVLFYAKYDKNASEDSVYITNITISPLYYQGQLSIDSESDTIYTESHDIESITKPTWSKVSGNMNVEISQFYDKVSGTYKDYFTIRKDSTSTVNEENVDMTRLVTQPGLLIIPRQYTDSDGKRLVISVTYKRRKNDERTYTVKTTIKDQTFLGNTVYAMRLTVGSALVAEITSVNVATSNWNEEEGNHEVHNW